MKEIDNLVSWKCPKCTFENNNIDDVFECKICKNKRNTEDTNQIVELAKSQY